LQVLVVFDEYYRLILSGCAEHIKVITSYSDTSGLFTRYVSPLSASHAVRGFKDFIKKHGDEIK